MHRQMRDGQGTMTYARWPTARGAKSDIFNLK